MDEPFRGVEADATPLKICGKRSEVIRGDVRHTDIGGFAAEMHGYLGSAFSGVIRFLCSVTAIEYQRLLDAMQFEPSLHSAQDVEQCRIHGDSPICLDIAQQITDPAIPFDLVFTIRPVNNPVLFAGCRAFQPKTSWVFPKGLAKDKAWRPKREESCSGTLKKLATVHTRCVLFEWPM